MSKQKQSDRRAYIRVKDRILLEFEPIDEDDFRERVKAYEEGRDIPWSICTHLQFAQDLSLPLRKIREKDEALATVLEVLDQKLNLILNKLSTEGDKCPATPYTVDLSAAGLAFFYPREIPKGTILKLDIGLLPQQQFFRCFGKVIRCVPKGENKFEVGVSFIWIMEDDKERLIEHIFQRQVLQLRLRRQQREKED